MQPLKNIKVLIPRPVGRTDEMADKLRKLGAIPIIFPLIEIKAINQDKLVHSFTENKYDWIIFTSGIAVQIFFDSVSPTNITQKIAVVGTSTKKTIEKLGLKVAFMPSAATAKKLVKEIPLNKGDKVLIPRSKIAGKGIIDVLKQKEIEVTEIATYNNTPISYAKEEIEKVFNKNINVIIFTSGSTVDSFVHLLKKHQLKINESYLVSIGPSTTSVLNKYQLKTELTAEQHNIDGLIEGIKSLYKTSVNK